MNNRLNNLDDTDKKCIFSNAFVDMANYLELPFLISGADDGFMEYWNVKSGEKELYRYESEEITNKNKRFIELIKIISDYLFDKNNITYEEYLKCKQELMKFDSIHKRRNMIELNKIYCQDNLELMKLIPDNFIDLIITSPNYNNWRNKRTQKSRGDYWKRTNIIYDNVSDKQTDEEYEEQQIITINEMVRILKPTGTICYNHKDRIFNFEVKSPLEWILKTKAKHRQRITWGRTMMQAYNPVRFYRTDEDIYILGKETKGFKWNSEFAKYLSIWRIPPSKNIYGHNATFPEEIVKRCIESFTDENDIVFDPYNGVGTTTFVANKMNRKYIGCDLGQKYCDVAEKRINNK